VSTALSWTARRVVAVFVFAAAYGAQDLVRSVPGPQVPLALPLRETGHAAGVPLVAFLALWLVAFALAARLAPPLRAHPALVVAVRALVALGAMLVVQAVSFELVRQATLGLDWRAAVASASPWLVAACATLATLLVLLAPRQLARVRQLARRPRGTALEA
jgi:hypothetical protein